MIMLLLIEARTCPPKSHAYARGKYGKRVGSVLKRMPLTKANLQVGHTAAVAITVALPTHGAVQGQLFAVTETEQKVSSAKSSDEETDSQQG
jgi:hypothetical protein